MSDDCRYGQCPCCGDRVVRDHGRELDDAVEATAIEMAGDRWADLPDIPKIEAITKRCITVADDKFSE
jgi:hypothetical protein